MMSYRCAIINEIQNRIPGKLEIAERDDAVEPPIATTVMAKFEKNKHK